MRGCPCPLVKRLAAVPLQGQLRGRLHTRRPQPGGYRFLGRCELGLLAPGAASSHQAALFAYAAKASALTLRIPEGSGTAWRGPVFGSCPDYLYVEVEVELPGVRPQPLRVYLRLALVLDP